MDEKYPVPQENKIFIDLLGEEDEKKVPKKRGKKKTLTSEHEKHGIVNVTAADIEQFGYVKVPRHRNLQRAYRTSEPEGKALLLFDYLSGRVQLSTSQRTDARALITKYI